MQRKNFAFALLAYLFSAGVACSTSDGPSPGSAMHQPGGGGEGTTGSGATGSTLVSGGGTGGFVVDEGVGLTSSVFGSLADLIAEGGGQVVACDYGATRSCDYTRVDGCCAHLACLHASDDNPDDPYPMEFCQTLLACAQEVNAGCSTAADPLCLGNETGPCVDNSHGDPNGPFPHTLELMNCLCGY